MVWPAFNVILLPRGWGIIAGHPVGIQIDNAHFFLYLDAIQQVISFFIFNVGTVVTDIYCFFEH